MTRRYGINWRGTATCAAATPMNVSSSNSWDIKISLHRNAEDWIVSLFHNPDAKSHAKQDEHLAVSNGTLNATLLKMVLPLRYKHELRPKPDHKNNHSSGKKLVR
jgi:hypothetical protein